MDCAEIWSVARGPLGDGGYLHEHTGNCHTFKLIYSLPLVHRLKGVLLIVESALRTSLRPTRFYGNVAGFQIVMF